MKILSVASKVLNVNGNGGIGNVEVFGYQLPPNVPEVEETINVNPPPRPPINFGFPSVDTGFPPAPIPRPFEPNRFPQILQTPPPPVPIPPPPPPPQNNPNAKSPSFQPPSNGPPSAGGSQGSKPQISFAIDEAAQSAPAAFKQQPPSESQLPIFFGTRPPPPPWFNGNAPAAGSLPFQNRPQPIPQQFQSIPVPAPIPPPPPPPPSQSFQNRPNSQPPIFRGPPQQAAQSPFFPPKFAGPQRSNNGNKLVPLCPNGLRALTFADGGVIRCLPGQQQCPQNASCNFNGLDYYCCPYISEASGGGVHTSQPDNTVNEQTEG